MKKVLVLIFLMSFIVLNISAQREEIIKFADFEQWLTRDI